MPSLPSTVWQYDWGGEWSSGGWGSAPSTWCEWSRQWIAWQGASGTWWDNKRQKVELVEQAELVKRLKKLMHDVGDIEPESLFLSVIHFESLGVWRLGF